jgi:predicted extracellular nuclease
MKKLVASINSPGQLTVLAALLAGLCAPALAASDIVISQVYGGGGNSGATLKQDYIELFNRGTGPVAIGGWSVQYASASASSLPTASQSWAVTAIPAGTILNAGQYYMVREAQGTTAGTVDVAGDVIGTIALSASAGKVALVNNKTALTFATPLIGSYVDLVGFGSVTTGAYEGAGPTAGTTNTTGVLRKDGGCVDSDANNTDFVVGTPTPRNSATVPHVCGLPQLTCPTNMSVMVGRNASVTMSAYGTDAIVNNAVIKSGGVPGISLSSFLASGAAGGDASVNLDVTSAVPLGSYPVAVEFSDDQTQKASCTVNVSVQQLVPMTFTIPQIQGSGDTSPHLGVQTTDGVVTKRVSTGFFLQDENGDGDSATSDAIFVFMGSSPFSVAAGDAVRVTGTVTEFKPTGAPRSVTEMSNVTTMLVRDNGHQIIPTNIVLPGDGLARYEGMLVHFNNPLIVNDTGSLGDRGELTLASVRREVPTNHFRPGSAGALVLAASNAADQIVLDDAIFVQSATIPYIGADNTVRSGDSVTDLVGVIDYGSIGNNNFSFKLQPISVPSVTISRTNPRTSAPVVPAGNVKVASANVLNFFTTFTDGVDITGTGGHGCTLGTTTSAGNCRGADSIAEFIRQRDKIVNELKAIDADVVGLMEIQNNGNVAVSYLVDQLNLAVGANTYAAVAYPSFTGTDAIRVAMIYKPAVLTPVGPPIADPDTVINNRAPLAQTFKAGNGAKFSVIVNHLKSKSCGSASGTNLDQHDGQGCWNPDRVAQANRLSTVFIPQVIAASGDPDVLIIGDFNSHGFEDPINVLTTGGMVNELERFVRPGGIVYSYVFDGMLGYLDHAMATASLDLQMAGATEWHNNADEPEVIDYNFTLGTSKVLKPQDLYENNAYRASDHDPVVVSLNLTPTFVNVTSSFSTYRSGLNWNRITGQFSGTLVLTNTTGSTINGPFQVELSGLPSGVTLANATGMHNGVPYITATASSVAPGATVTISTVFNNPTKGVIPYTAIISSGSF